MSTNTLLLLIGGSLVVVGVLISGGGNKSGAPRVGNTGFSVFGSVKQSFQSVGLTIKGEREGKPRDWVGWGLTACGLVISLLGLINSWKS